MGQEQQSKVLYKKGILKILENSQESACSRDSFFNKVASLVRSFFKKETLARCFPVNFTFNRLSCIFQNLVKTKRIVENAHCWVSFAFVAILQKKLSASVMRHHTETYSDIYQTSNMKCFVKIVSDFLPLPIFAKHSILNVWQGHECASVISTLFIF